MPEQQPNGPELGGNEGSQLDRALQIASNPLTPEQGQEAREVIEFHTQEAVGDLLDVLSAGQLDRALRTNYTEDQIEDVKEDLRDKLLNIHLYLKNKRMGQPQQAKGLREPQSREV